MPVFIKNSNDEAVLLESSITSGRSWHNFSETIKYKNRFYDNIFNPDVLATYLSYLEKKYPAGTIMYRVRICEDETGYSNDKMGAPPQEKRTAGRVNPEGVGVLYLSLEEDTALYEVRSNIYDYITIGEFRLLEDIRVVDLAGINSVSPFVFTESEDLHKFTINLSCLREIAADIRKLLRRNDSLLEYLPTQVVSEYIKNQRYHGVEYSSTMTENGSNLAIFNDRQFECIKTKVYEIKSLTYDSREISCISTR